MPVYGTLRGDANTIFILTAQAGGEGMRRATPAQIRASLVIADELKRAGVAFVPMPILNDAEELHRDLTRRLDIIEQLVDDDAQPGQEG